jgi:ABC-type siderophore export system fused ATPase/permease subunit
VKARSALVYSVLRLLAFLVPFGIMMLFPIFQQLYWLAAIFAALIGLSLSLLFLRRPLNEVTSSLGAGRRERSPRAENAAVDADAGDEDAAADAMAREQAVDQPTKAQNKNTP